MQLDRVTLGREKPNDDFEKNLERSFTKLVDQLVELFKNGITFADNFNGYLTTITTDATPGVETAITHTLKKIPTGCVVLEKDKAGHVFLGASGKSSTVYNVASDVASVTATLLII